MKKLIAWENWNEIEKELTEEFDLEDIIVDNEEESLAMANDFLMGPILSDMKPQIIQTPFGNVTAESKLKPSDRWECWIGYTNFGITEDIQSKLEHVDGVDALKVMSRYSFCVGVGKMFKFSTVRKDIENAICKRDVRASDEK